ncbi:MAG: transaldolase [Coxiella sp. (in: Bacteria)]|nr:MAG: transaldolase [Coxiella sp. (in: g-proteobacteria)]
MKIFMDGASIDDMLHYHNNALAQGFTTNPTLMRKAGIADYETFAHKVLSVIKDVSVSFEVFSDDFKSMEAEARTIASWGNNVYVKIPVSNTKGESSLPLIRTLLNDGIPVNITALLDPTDISAVIDATTNFKTPSIVSIFAGRIADTGQDPLPLMKQSVERTKEFPHVEILWASPREVFNIVQAEKIGCDIITCTPALLKKRPLIGKNLKQFSLETVQMFYDDACAAGYAIKLNEPMTA